MIGRGSCRWHKTALFSALFSTNIYFWLDMGYFQPNAHGNPLLNLWSLGVEEQFYLFIPLLSLLLWKIRRKALIYAYSIGLLLSLALCLYLGHRGDSTTAFYLLPTRAWEFLAGGMLALAPQAVDSWRFRVPGGRVLSSDTHAAIYQWAEFQSL
ncbi:MAG: hypothetical protein WDN28_10140 [Chthoniobacter sp.]